MYQCEIVNFLSLNFSLFTHFLQKVECANIDGCHPSMWDWLKLKHKGQKIRFGKITSAAAAAARLYFSKSVARGKASPGGGRPPMRLGKASP